MFFVHWTFSGIFRWSFTSVISGVYVIVCPETGSACQGWKKGDGSFLVH